MKTAFFLFDLAERMQGEGKARLFELSYTVSLTSAKHTLVILRKDQHATHRQNMTDTDESFLALLIISPYMCVCVMCVFVFAGQLYKEIVEAHSDYPSNWDKNLALACERLLRSGHRGHSPDSLLTCSAQHFRLYLEKEHTDPQAPAIRSAITHLLQERDRLHQSQRRTP